MKIAKTPKYFGLRGLHWESKKQLFEFAEKSVYYWWWQFLRLTPEFWYANRTKRPIVDPKLREVYELIGGYPGFSFKVWWDRYGADAFKEQDRDDQPLLIKSIKDYVPRENSCLLEVPLTQNKRDIQLHFARLLNTVHRGRLYDLDAYTNAKLRIYTHKYNIAAIERQYWVMLYKIIYPEAPLWVVGDRLQYAPQNEVRNLDRRTVERTAAIQFLRLQSQMWRYHDHALNMRQHILNGSFPNHFKPEVKAQATEEYMPFGAKYDQDFKEQTSERANANSPWQQWIKRQYEKKLHAKVNSANRFDVYYKDNTQFRGNFKKFLNGTLEM